MNNYVAYYRVSTQRQGKSGLGLESQRKMVTDYVASQKGTIIAEFTEVESGKGIGTNRPQLRNALAVAKRKCNNATLVVAKLDRLSRNVAFISALLETPGVEFKAADFPDANRMMLQIIAVIAEYEAKQISERTKAALAAYKARGNKLGKPENLNRGNLVIPTRNKAVAQSEAERLRPVVESIQATGVTSIRGLTEALNSKGYLTERGNSWHPATVARVLGRLKTA